MEAESRAAVAEVSLNDLQNQMNSGQAEKAIAEERAQVLQTQV